MAAESISDKVRILTVSHFFESHGGGIERVAGHLCRHFAVQHHLPLWAASRADLAPTESTIHPVPLACLNPLEKLTGLPMPIPSLSAIKALSQAIKLSDAVVIHDALYLTSIIAMVLAKRAKKRVVLIQHIAEIPFSSKVLRIVMRLANATVARAMLETADHLVFISETTRRAFSNVKTARPTSVLYNGVDSACFHNDSRNDIDIRAQYGLAPGRKIMIFVGRFVEKKGLGVIRILAQKLPETAFLLVGQGPIAPASWGLANVYLTGLLTASQIAVLYRAADALILPSVGEGYPLVVQEAMACGLAVVCGAETAEADPEAKQWLRGVPIDLSEPNQTADGCLSAIKSLAMTPTDLEEMSRWACKRYSWSNMAAQIIAMIHAA